MATLNVYPTGIADTPYVAQISFEQVQQLLNNSANVVNTRVSDNNNNGNSNNSTDKTPKSASKQSTNNTTSNNGTISQRDIETVILLDVSGSMGQNVNRLVSNYIPNALEKAGYQETDIIHLITFSNGATLYKFPLNDFRLSKMGCQGATYMKGGVEEILKLAMNSQNRMMRILTISDGELHDQVPTLEAASKLASYMKEQNFSTSSSAIRFFTSRMQPDTRGLSSMLQLDNVNSTNQRTLVDLNSTSDSTYIVYSMAELLKDKMGNSRVVIKANAPIFLRTPWSTPSCEFLLNEGQNTFWLTRAISADDLISIVVPSTNSSNASNDSLYAAGTSEASDPSSSSDVEPSNKATGIFSRVMGRFKSSKASNSDKTVRDLGSSEGSEGSGRIEVLVKLGDSLNYESYNGILKERVDYFMNRLRILKVLNTPDAQKEVQSIIEHFKKLEGIFERQDQSLQGLLKNNLQSRLAFFRGLCEKKSKSVSLKMAEVANDDRVNQMNSAQQADYLRSANTSSNAKNLAKRAIKSGLDFDGIAASEVKAMKAHLHELDGIDDSNHYISFYSQETTLQGIKAVCELVDAKDTIESMSALDILQLLNIVGIPCQGPIGDYPDPKTYHLQEMFLGSFVSMSDVMMVKQGGMILKDPYASPNKEIINVIPFYDDDRIQQFLMKYAKTLLEYTASLGMRNMILDVPHTYKYTIVGGLWNMARRLNDERTEVNVDVFTKLVKTYATAVDHIFDYVVPLIKEQTEEEKANNKSFYISNNGTTNMISPMINIAATYALSFSPDKASDKSSDKASVKVGRISVKGESGSKVAADKSSDKASSKASAKASSKVPAKVSPNAKTLAETRGDDNRYKFMPDILRALYSFEIYQVIRKFHKSDDDKVELRKKMLDKLLGIDFTKYGTPLPPLYEEVGKGSKAPTHYSNWHVDDQMLDNLINRMFWLDHIVNLPEFLLNSFRGAEGKAAILAMPQPLLSEKRIMENLGLSQDATTNSKPQDLRTFKLFCIVQSFLFDNKADRVNADNTAMLIEDCGNNERMTNMLQTYIEKQYRADFQSKLAQQNKLERELIAQELADKMALIDDEKGFIDLFKTGLQRNHVSAIISDSYQLGFTALRDRLFDPKFSVKHRKFKLTVFVMGVDREGAPVWNKGNALRAVPLNMLKEAFFNNGLEKFWEEILYPAFKSKNKYMYRDSDKANRHTHCNSKASFWAFGYPTVGKYFSEISQAERDEYCKIHTHCCGIWDGKLVKPA